MACITDVSSFLPARVVTNEDLHRENPEWDTERISAKTGIASRHIVAENETASDLAFEAAERLFANSAVRRAEIDYVLFCTQSPDYALPASACILQDRLHLPTSCGAIDINQGCSGYVYGIQLANALVDSETANNVLLLTGETYSRYIHSRDRSVRVLFGDAGTATLVRRSNSGARIVTTLVGTDGSGYKNLIVPKSGAREPRAGEPLVDLADASGNVRNAGNLFMDGQELFSFTIKRVPSLVHSLLEKAKLTPEQIDCFIFHQANAYMNEHLRKKINIPKEKAPLMMADVGNTVSNTIPLTLTRASTRFDAGDRIALVGFGVGYSWGACLLEWGDVTVSMCDAAEKSAAGSQSSGEPVETDA